MKRRSKGMSTFSQTVVLKWLQHEVYTRIFRACEIAGFTEEKLIKYEKEMYDEKRRNSEMNTARRIGYENGLKAGMRDGHAEGRA